MAQHCILCIESDPKSLQALQWVLNGFAKKFSLRFVKDQTSATQELTKIQQNGDHLALIIASQSKSTQAAELLVELEQHQSKARKLLLCEPTQLATILTAVNQGRLDHCFTKPIDIDEAITIVRKELTHYILDIPKLDWLSFGSVLDSQRIIRAHIDRRIHDYRQNFIKDYHSISDEELSEKVCSALQDFFSKGDETRALRQYSPSHLLTKEGESNEFLWFIIDGEIALYKKDEHNKSREVTRHGKGGIIGGMSFVTGEKSFSTAITYSATRVIKLSKQTFTKVMHSNSAILPLFTNLLLRHANRRLQRSINTKMRLEHTYESLAAAQAQLVENEKMVVLGQLVAGVAHELNNPIAAILRSSDTLKQEFSRQTNTFNPISLALGNQVLHRALQSNPIPTAEIRRQAKALSETIPDKKIAKQVVAMGLQQQLQTLSNTEYPLPKLISELEHFHTCGTTLRSIDVCSRRIANMVKSLKSYARSDEESIQTVDIHEGIEDTLVIFENRLKKLTVVRDYQDIPAISCQPIALQQVWTNLVANALDAMPEKGKLVVSTRLIKNSHIAVSFADSGCGIDSDLQQRIFDLNYTTKTEGDFGLGIGLSVCQQIIHRHQGEITVRSAKNSGTTMSVIIPYQMQ
ncbi:ATP-binding protein [Vibrio gallicus]|uniref:ATP-binding protein n=1 Tax=Vibrio gallicus TaxID=190897 RepID=UPI0021C439BF|nr:ATP-binding protein [Vibrio gallicus]